jgi:hypothetical protein
MILKQASPAFNAMCLSKEVAYGQPLPRQDRNLQACRGK